MRRKEGKPVILDEKGKKPLKLDYPQTFKVGLAYAIIMLFWTAYDFVVPLLLEQAYGLPSWARGLIMGLDNLLALFMLPFFGKLSDKAHGKLAKKFGRRTPFIMIGTICAALLMVFVPVSTLNQQQDATCQLQNHIETEFDYGTELAKWYDAALNGETIYGESARNFCDIDYLNRNQKLYAKDGMSKAEIETARREFFISLRPYEKLTSKKAVLNMFGEITYYYDGVEIENLSTLCPDTGKSYEEMAKIQANYKKFAKSGMGNYESCWIYRNVTTKTGTKSLAVYIVILLLVLIAMATFRSPAVALMPDVTPKPLRSQANAVIKLCGGAGGAIAFLIYTIVLFGTRLENYVIIFASVAAGMLLLLAGFLALVKERKLFERCQEIRKQYKIDDFAEDESHKAEKFAEDTIAKKKFASPKEWWGAKSDAEKGKIKSLILILASIFMWFMGYNAVSSNLSIYTTKSLNFSSGVASVISGVSKGLSAIAFIPVGYLAAKIGRKKSIIIGFGLALISFVLICFAVRTSDNQLIPAVMFSLFYLIAGFGLNVVNVNTFPMVAELSTTKTIGQYTGYYYIASMTAKTITPMLSGLVMDFIEDKYLFLYSSICIVIAIVLMLFVKHGDSISLSSIKAICKAEKK